MRYETILLCFSLILFFPFSEATGWTTSITVPDYGHKQSNDISPADNNIAIQLVNITQTKVTFSVKCGKDVTENITKIALRYAPLKKMKSGATLDWNPEAGYYVVNRARTLFDNVTLKYVRSESSAEPWLLEARLKFPNTRYRFDFEFYDANGSLVPFDVGLSTLPTPPASLKTGIGCFQVYQANATHRTARVFWQPVLDETLHVDSVAYEDLKVPRVVAQKVTNASRGQVLLDLISMERHHVVLTLVSTVSGRSFTSSVVPIPAQEDILPPVLTHVIVNQMTTDSEVLKGVVSVYWQKPKNMAVVNYTVAIISAADPKMPISFFQDFTYLPATDEETVEFHVKARVEQQIAVSVNADSASSGLHNADQIESSS